MPPSSSEKTQGQSADLDIDILLLEKYKEFAEALLKASLAVVAVLGFFLDKVSTASYFSVSSREVIFRQLIFSAALFVGSGAATLMHRLIGLLGASLAVRALRRARSGLAAGSVRDGRVSRLSYVSSSLLLAAAALLAVAGALVLLFALSSASLGFSP